jgi:hypothetical protein
MLRRMESKKCVRSLFDFSMYRIRLTTAVINPMPTTSGTKKEGFSISTNENNKERPAIRMARRNMLIRKCLWIMETVWIA